MSPRPRPDLTYPLLPDTEDLHPGRSFVPVERGGTSLRPVLHGEGFEWPEAGPSISSSDRTAAETGSGPFLCAGEGVGEDGDGPLVGPFGAKLVAAMTGAMSTSLLMTPFDVLKTRLQTVQPHPRITWTPPADNCCQTSALTPSPSTSNSSRPIPALSAASATTTNSTSNPLTCFTTVPPSSMISPKPLPPTSLRPASTPAAPPSGCAFPSKWAGIWGEAVTLEEALARGVVGVGNGGGIGSAAMGGVRGGGGATLVLPQEGWGMGGFWNEVAAVRRETGIRGLWKGVGTTLTMSIPSAAIYMLGYEHLLTLISPYFVSSTDPSAHISSINRPQSSSRSSSAPSLTPAPLIAGSLARTLSASVISPIEMFRTRLQALPTADRGSPTYASTAKEMGKLVQTKGFTILWRGLGPTLWRDVPFSGIYWAGFELLKSRLSSHSSPLPPMSPITTSFVSGAISGTISALLTQPFDVLKTRRQVFTPSSTCSPAALRHRASTIPLAVHVVKSEGWGALFAGTVPRCAKVAPACGLMIACYEGVGRWLGGRGVGK